MRRTILAAAAALLWALPAAAVEQAKDPRDAQGDPILPEGPRTRPPLAETPDREAAPGREAREKEIRRDVEAWRERVETWRREHEAYGGDEEAARMAEALRNVEQSWRRLAQTTGPDWDYAMMQLESARNELERAWKEANG